MNRIAFFGLLAAAAFALSACESDPVTTHEPVSTPAMKSIDVTPQTPQTAIPYKP